MWKERHNGCEIFKMSYLPAREMLLIPILSKTEAGELSVWGQSGLHNKTLSEKSINSKELWNLLVNGKVWKKQVPDDKLEKNWKV